MKRIGYVDFDLENFHANVYLAAFRKELAGRGFEVAGCTAIRESEGRAWAAKNGVPCFASVDELDRHVDCYAVLAPSRPETHLELCREVLPRGKPTYVDKTFAPDLETARAIFGLADAHGAPIQTTSALRYTNVQTHVREVGRENVRHMVAWGGGRSFDEYAIHPVEMVVSCMGPEVEGLMRRGVGDQSQLLLDFSGGRTAAVNVYTNADTPYAAAVTTAKGTKVMAADTSRLFIDMAAAMLDFFESGRPNIERAESLAVRRILDAAARPRAIEGFIEV